MYSIDDYSSSYRYFGPKKEGRVSKATAIYPDIYLSI